MGMYEDISRRLICVLVENNLNVVQVVNIMKVVDEIKASMLSLIIDNEKLKGRNNVLEKMVPWISSKAVENGAILRTRSQAKKQKLLKNKKFSEAGLEVSVKPAPSAKIIVQGVHKAIKPDEFMEEIYSINLKDHNAASCNNELHCRNCALRRLPSGHLMMSIMCPVYVGILARKQSRHYDG